MRNGFQRQDIYTSQTVGLRVDPRVVLSGQLLELTSLELRTAIEAELLENPALEWLDEGLEPIERETILESIAPYELRPNGENYELHRSLPSDCDETDWMDLAASFTSLEDHLEAQLSVELEPKYHGIAQVLIASLNERGYLRFEVEEIALDNNLDLDDVAHVLTKLQACDPAGIAARNLQECLALQLQNSKSDERRLAYQIVTEAFDELVDRNIRTLMRKFRTMPDLVHAALEEIQSLTPFPAEAFERRAHHHSPQRSVSAQVDLRLKRDESGWEVLLPGVTSEDLVINRSYRLRLKQLADRRGDNEKKHLRQFVSRAQTFIDALGQRGETLRRIGNYLIEKQAGFVTTGDVAFLKSLTRRQMAADLGLHESTISRATAGKHVQIANGEVISFEIFFKPALRVQQLITEILSNEEPGQRLSDERIAQLLADRGVHVARRTVNKYRDRSKTLSSRRRRSA